MSAKDRDRGRDVRQARGPAARVRGVSRGRVLQVATALLIVAAVFTWLGSRTRVAPPGAEITPISDPILALTPEAAYEAGLRLSQAGRLSESLPYYRRAVTGGTRVPWVVHYYYAGALYGVGFEIRNHHGVAVSALRSSIERVALMREALAELDIAEGLTTNARDRATVIRARGERFQIWGFPWDGFVQLRKAQWTDPSRKELGAAADAYMRVLEHPERPRLSATEGKTP